MAVTDGPAAARIHSRDRAWEISLPRLENIVSPIGAGDCATAMMAHALASGGAAMLDDAPTMAEAFAHALACASASCLTDTPSVFDDAVAATIRPQIEPL